MQFVLRSKTSKIIAVQLVAHWERRMMWWYVAHWDSRWYSYLVTTWLTKANLCVIYYVIVLGRN